MLYFELFHVYCRATRNDYTLMKYFSDHLMSEIKTATSTIWTEI